MAYVCEACGEKVEDGKICICELDRKKEILKARKKTYKVMKRGEKDLISHILKIRKVEEDYSTFLNIDFSSLFNDKFLNQEEAVQRIIRALEKGEKIAIYGDYDADGITGTAVGYNILTGLGGNVTYYINDRFKEGFGINVSGVEKLYKEKVRLIITVDNGIAGVEGASRAKELGLDVLVTDHHEANESLPDCLIVDPKQPGCPSLNKDITGVGVLFKVLLDVCSILGKEAVAKKEMDLVALGTVADMGPLLGENRLLIRTGLMIWNLSKGKYGIRRLIEKLGINRAITSYDLGFIFGPILNAESRLRGKPEKGILILTSNNQAEIDGAVDELIAINQKRKEMLEEQLLIGDSLIEPDKWLFFIHHEKIAEGIAGLIASRLMETYKRPVIVLGKTNEGTYKGSGRSLGEFNLKKALDKNSKLLLYYGGHKLACGMTVESENLDLVKNLLETEAKFQLSGIEVKEEVVVDEELEFEEFDEELVNRLSSLEPYGIGFKKPVFLMRNIQADKVTLMKEIHSKFNWKGIDFLSFNNLLEGGKSYNLIGYPQINNYNGRKTVQFIVNDVLKEDSEICESET